MNKVFFLMLLIFFSSCSFPKEETNELGYRRVIQDDGTIFDAKQSSNDASINPVSWYEIEKDGNRHEFISVGAGGGVVHWPECKFCKNKNNE